jgi:hypothetical protein
MTDAELMAAIDELRSTMISVATGGERIEQANQQYQQTYHDVAFELDQRGIPMPIPYSDLWGWHGRWSSGDMPRYRDRRTFVAGLINPLLTRLKSNVAPEYEPTGWLKVDRQIAEMRNRLSSAATEEQSQAVGLICREALISAAQVVYKAESHPTLDGVTPSKTDAKRMLEAYIAVEIGGGSNDEIRKHARSALDLSLNLQHKRTATFRDASICAVATVSVIHILAIVAGRRDQVP